MLLHLVILSTIAAADGGSVAAVPLQPPTLAAAATLVGRVVDVRGRPLSGARVTLVGTEVELITDRRGRFGQTSMPPGQQQLEVDLVGHVPQRLTVDLRSGATAQVEVVLLRRVVELEEVRAETKRTPSAFGGFYERRERGPGYFITREEIARRRPRQLSDMLSVIPGLYLNPSTYGSYEVTVNRSRTVRGGCPIRVFLNGLPYQVEPGRSIDEIRVQDLEGVEVYRNPGETPARFSGGAAACGVIVVWVRDGEPRRLGSN
jgi:hypothetical protein